MVYFCAEKGLCVSNTYFTHKNLHYYTMVKNMIDLAFVKKVMLRYVHDVRVVKEMGRVLSDHQDRYRE